MILEEYLSHSCDTSNYFMYLRLLQRDELQIGHQRELISVRSSTSESETRLITLRNELDLRDVRIQELETRNATMRKELAANDELIATLRVQSQEASSRLSFVQVCAGRKR